MSNNDFTLEELEELHVIYDRFCDEQYNRGTLVKSETKLLAKLRELIDNYCEHDFKQTHIEIEMEYCTKCGVQAI